MADEVIKILFPLGTTHTKEQLETAASLGYEEVKRFIQGAYARPGILARSLTADVLKPTVDGTNVVVSPGWGITAGGEIIHISGTSSISTGLVAPGNVGKVLFIGFTDTTGTPQTVHPGYGTYPYAGVHRSYYFAFRTWTPSYDNIPDEEIPLGKLTSATAFDLSPGYRLIAMPHLPFVGDTGFISGDTTASVTVGDSVYSFLASKGRHPDGRTTQNPHALWIGDVWPEYPDDPPQAPNNIQYETGVETNALSDPSQVVPPKQGGYLRVWWGETGTDGVAGSDATGYYMEDTSKSWAVDEWKDHWLYLPSTGATLKILSNTATKVYVSSLPNASGNYRIIPYPKINYAELLVWGGDTTSTLRAMMPSYQRETDANGILVDYIYARSLLVGKPYYAKLRFVNYAGASDWSSTWSFTITDEFAPKTPVYLTHVYYSDYSPPDTAPSWRLPDNPVTTSTNITFWLGDHGTGSRDASNSKRLNVTGTDSEADWPMSDGVGSFVGYYLYLSGHSSPWIVTDHDSGTYIEVNEDLPANYTGSFLLSPVGPGGLLLGSAVDADDQWHIIVESSSSIVSIDEAPRLTFQHLPVGISYTFSIRAKSITGDVSERLIFDLTADPSEDLQWVRASDPPIIGMTVDGGFKVLIPDVNVLSTTNRYKFGGFEIAYSTGASEADCPEPQFELGREDTYIIQTAQRTVIIPADPGEYVKVRVRMYDRYGKIQDETLSVEGIAGGTIADLRDEIAAARGSFSSLNDRISAAIDEDGNITAEGVASLGIASRLATLETTIETRAPSYAALLNDPDDVIYDGSTAATWEDLVGVPFRKVSGFTTVTANFWGKSESSNGTSSSGTKAPSYARLMVSDGTTILTSAAYTLSNSWTITNISLDISSLEDTRLEITLQGKGGGVSYPSVKGLSLDVS